MMQPGWYADPQGRHEHRFHDGSRWTANVADAGAQSTDAVTPGAVVAPPRPSFAPGAPGAAYYAPPGATAPSVGGSGSRTLTLPTVLAGIGSILLVVGAFLPWAKVQAGFASIEVAGTDGSNDGWWTLAFGAAALLALLVSQPKVRAVLMLVFGAIAAWISIDDLVKVRDGIDKLSSSSSVITVHASVGIGLWASCLGAVLLIVGAIATFGERN